MTHHEKHRISVVFVFSLSVNKNRRVNKIFCPVWTSLHVKSHVPVSPTSNSRIEIFDNVVSICFSSRPVTQNWSSSEKEWDCRDISNASFSREDEFFGVFLSRFLDTLESSPKPSDFVVCRLVPVNSDSVNVFSGFRIT